MSEENQDLLRASVRGDVQAIRVLLEQGADIHFMKDVCLRNAAGEGRLEAVKLLLKHGADIHAKEDQAIRWASEKGFTEIVLLLLKHGADFRAENNWALKQAVMRKHPKTAKILLGRYGLRELKDMLGKKANPHAEIKAELNRRKEGLIEKMRQPHPGRQAQRALEI
jgi:hypothetical protein